MAEVQESKPIGTESGLLPSHGQSTACDQVKVTGREDTMALARLWQGMGVLLPHHRDGNTGTVIYSSLQWVGWGSHCVGGGGRWARSDTTDVHFLESSLAVA